MAFMLRRLAGAFFAMMVLFSGGACAKEAPAPTIQLVPPQPVPSPDVTSPKDFAKGHSKIPVTAQSRCGEVGAMQYMLMSTRQLAFLATSIDSDETVHIYMRNPKTEQWAELEMAPNLTACIVREGRDFHFMFKQ